MIEKKDMTPISIVVRNVIEANAPVRNAQRSCLFLKKVIAHRIVNRPKANLNPPQCVAQKGLIVSTASKTPNKYGKKRPLQRALPIK